MNNKRFLPLPTAFGLAFGVAFFGVLGYEFGGFVSELAGGIFIAWSLAP